MRESLTASRWTRHFVCRTERTRTTWKFRVGLLALFALTGWVTGGWWSAALGRSLACNSNAAPSDGILVENLDPDYLLFERAARLRQRGFAERVFVPVHRDPATGEPNDVAVAVAQVMARISRVGPIELVPFREVEPITLNAAVDVQRFLEREHIRSVIIVSPLFRSRRSALVYAATLGRAGIAVRCSPVQGSRGVEDWTHTWHGVQEVVEQWMKLQYYRFYVLPFRH